jgi:hypothetical protein
MKVVKLALLGTAALAAVSVSARADDLADLKAQIEALNGRISQLEATPSVPAGYQLLSVSETNAIIVPGLINDANGRDFGSKATNIGILPTADVPASTNLQWSGYVRAAVTYVDGAVEVDGETVDGDAFDIRTKVGLKFVGTTDTAVGEVGVRATFVAASAGAALINRGNSSVETDGYWGWWKMTPELTLAGGVDGTLANSSNAFDNRCSCYYIDTGGAFATAGGGGDPSQIRLSYASGPISFAVAVEDYDNDGDSSAVGVAAEMKYSGDTVGFDINAGYWDPTSGNVGGDADWTVNAGANLGLGDIASLGIAVGLGESGHTADDDFMRASMFMGFTLSDAVAAELGVTYTDLDAGDNLTVAGGLYYTPVSQLTLGLEASYSDTKGAADVTKAALVSIYRF